MSTEASIAANIGSGFCPKIRSAAVVSYCQELCTPGSRGVLCYPESILKDRPLHDLWQVMRRP
jgi:hypothetical protein